MSKYKELSTSGTRQRNKYNKKRTSKIEHLTAFILHQSFLFALFSETWILGVVVQYPVLARTHRQFAFFSVRRSQSQVYSQSTPQVTSQGLKVPDLAAMVVE
jgi:hypothetical protein